MPLWSQAIPSRLVSESGHLDAQPVFGGGRGDAADRSVAGVTAAGDPYRWFRPAYLQGRAFIDKFAGNLFTLWRAAFPLIGLVRDFSRNSKFI